MSNISRRKLIASAIAAPAVAPGLPNVAIALPAGPNQLVVRAAAWIAKDEHLTAMQQRWQEFEGLLFDKARRMKMDCEEACRSNLPEALAMRALDRDIEGTRRRLDAEAEEIRLMPATTVAGAIAKIELGLKVQGPFDWRDHALELLEDGLAELRRFVG